MGFPGSVLLNQGDIYKQTSDKRYPLGTRGYTRDSRIFHYAENSSTAITLIGALCQCAVEPDAGKWSYDLPIDNIPTSNSSSILITATTISATAGYFEDGYLYINDGDGLGQMVQIKTLGTMASGATATEVRFYGDDKLITAVTTASVLGIVPNTYKDIIIKPATLITAPIAGVNPIAVSSDNFFWLQTWGPAPITVSAALDLNYPVICDSAKEAGVQKMSTATEMLDQVKVGMCMSVAQGGSDAALVFLQIAA